MQTPPTAEEAGHCNHVRVDEIGDTPVVVFKQGEYQHSALVMLVVILNYGLFLFFHQIPAVLWLLLLGYC